MQVYRDLTPIALETLAVLDHAQDGLREHQHAVGVMAPPPIPPFPGWSKSVPTLTPIPKGWKARKVKRAPGRPKAGAASPGVTYKTTGQDRAEKLARRMLRK